MNFYNKRLILNELLFRIMRVKMTHGSLFSGIGGFDLAASWLGWTNVFQCEIDPFCQKVLKYHFPDTELYGNIKETDFKKYNGTIDVISGGFPCQPFSVAGKRKGTADDRFLWDEMLRVIRDVQPSWIVAENVIGLLTQQSGVVFERVCSDLENIWYEVQPFVIPACAVNAPHRRDRVWIIANRSGAGIKSLQQWQNRIYESEAIAHATSHKNNRRGQGGFYAKPTGINAERITSHANKIGFKRREQAGKKWEMEKQSGRLHCTYNPFEKFPTQSPVCCGNDEFSAGLDGITFSKWRRKSIEAYGNAVVPQVVYQIFKTINEVEDERNDVYRSNV